MTNVYLPTLVLVSTRWWEITKVSQKYLFHSQKVPRKYFSYHDSQKCPKRTFYIVTSVPQQIAIGHHFFDRVRSRFFDIYVSDCMLVLNPATVVAGPFQERWSEQSAVRRCRAKAIRRRAANSEVSHSIDLGFHHHRRQHSNSNTIVSLQP